MTETDLSALPADRLADLIAKASAELARRAGGAPAAPRQLDLIPPPAPVDPDAIDLDERLPDGGFRWLPPKEAAYRKHTSSSTIIRMIVDGGAGIKRRGRYYFDASRLKGRS